MDISVSTAGAVTTARLAGELDTYTVPEVRTAFEKLAVVPDGKVVVDLREVTFMDSSGLGAVRLMNLDQVIDVVEEPDDERPSTTATEPSTPA